MKTAAITRPLRRIYLTGLACAVAAAVGGIADRASAIRTNRTGSPRASRAIGPRRDRERRERAERHRRIGRQRACVVRYGRGRPRGGARPLLDRADQALQARTAGVFAVTAYRPSGAWPLAWSGVPSEIGVDRIAGPETFFVAPGPLGLRLVYIKPVLDPVSGHRVGVIAAERVISSSRGIRTATPEEEVLSLPTLVPVTVRPYDDRGRRSGIRPFSRRSDSRCSTPASRLRRFRRRAQAWRANILAVVLGILAFTLVVSIPPLLRWRESLHRRCSAGT